MVTVPAPRKFTTGDIVLLRKRFVQGGADHATCHEQWRAARTGAPGSARALAEYHDLLLFLCAFPPDAEAHVLAETELDRITTLLAARSKPVARMREQLMNSGIARTPLCAGFGMDLCRWLAEVVPAGITIEPFTGDDDRMRGVLLACALGAESEAMEDAGYTVYERMRDACGGDPERMLRWLVRALDQAAAAPAVRNVLWERLSPVLSMKDPAAFLTRTYCRGLVTDLHPYDPAARNAIDPQRIIRTALPPPRRSQVEEKVALVHAARGVLIAHLRETDTATYCDPAAAEWQDLGDGLGIALLPLPPGRRTTFDSYVGYVLFSNAVPVAYGGAWIFPGKSKVGINVFPAFRGGPSMLLFARVLQCYAQRFGVDRFEAENYQLGHGNPDGIRSGAYWFYYRAGFRSVDGELAALAEAERAHITRDRAYRTPPTVLRKLAADTMVLELREAAPPPFEPSALIAAVFHGLATMRNGDRAAASHHCVGRVGEALGLPIGRPGPKPNAALSSTSPRRWPLIPDLERWPAKDKKDAVRVLRAKGQLNEDGYQAALRAHSRLLAAWRDLAS
ncbi:MAG: hypothetical protein IPK99_09640 [Flavobacteriales bacterium]|nr:hypothetical protein [Flavobacteriales bacterium]